MTVKQETERQNTIRQGACFIVYFNDFCTEMGLNYLLKSEHTGVGTYNTQHSIQQHTMPTYDLINYFSSLKKGCLDNRIIILTENKDVEVLNFLSSFNMFYLLSKKETPQFIHRVVTQPVEINKNVSPDIIDKIEDSAANKPLSRREWFVLQSLSRKLTPAAISKMAGINVKTVSAHKMRAMRKLGLNSSQFLQLLMRLAEVRNINTMILKESPK